MCKHVSITLAALLCGVSISARAQQPPAQPLPSGVVYETKFDPNQPIQPGFQVGVFVRTVEGQDESSGTYEVDPSGAINLKLVGRMVVKGQTPAEAAPKLAEAYKKFIKDPAVEVVILATPKPIVTISGAVTRPGPLPVSEGTSLAVALAMAGYTETADLSRIRLIRQANRVEQVSEYDLLRWLRPDPGQPPDSAQNPVLIDRDTVFVPAKGSVILGTASVEGDVVRPGPVSVRYGVGTKLREVLFSQVGGLNPSASYVITVRRAGQETPTDINFARMMAGDPQHNVDIRPDDVVFVAKLVEGQYVNVNGALARPGPQPVRGEMTLTQAIGLAGGPTLNAKEKEGRIFRHDPSNPTKPQVIAFDYSQLRQGKSLDVILRGGDIVEIPASEPRQRLDWLSILPALLSAAVLFRQ